MSKDVAVDRAREAGAKLRLLLLRAIAAVVVLGVFAGLGFLVFRGTIDDGPLLLYAGVLLGYVIHAAERRR
ncbi:MAG: hypothetical protein ABEI39_03050 [Halobacteriales archaeon]